MRMNIVLVHPYVASGVIPPDAERQIGQRMGATVGEPDSSHVVLVPHPEEIADLIETAVQGVAE
jgi:hypothetical protein